MSVCLIIGILYLHLCLVKTDTQVLYWENDNKTNIVYSFQSNNKNSSGKVFPKSETLLQKHVFIPLINHETSRTNSARSISVYGPTKIYDWIKYLLSRFTNLFTTTTTVDNQSSGLC